MTEKHVLSINLLKLKVPSDVALNLLVKLLVGVFLSSLNTCHYERLMSFLENADHFYLSTLDGLLFGALL